MTILFRYLLREYSKIFMMCFGALMTIYLVIDFFEKVRRFVRYDVHWLDVLVYFFLRAPAIALQITPLAILMATLLTFGFFFRNNEITAMRSCGLSLAWISSPFVTFAVGIAFVLLMGSSTLIPLATSWSEEIRTVRIEHKPEAQALTLQQPWIKISPTRLMHATTVSLDGTRLGTVRLFEFDEAFLLTKITEATDAQYLESTWTLHHGQNRQFHTGQPIVRTDFVRAPLPLSLIPDDFTTWRTNDSEVMTFHDIRAYTRRRTQQDSQATRLLTDYFHRMAFPFVTLIMVLVGIALSLRQSGQRGSSMTKGIGQALVISFCYWTVHSIAIALGRGGVLTPLVAGWLANLLFMSFALSLMLKVRY